jgi:hypothetical protein
VHQHPRQNRLDKLGGVFRHPPAPAARAEAPALAREGHQALERAALTADPHEAVSQDPTPQVGLELALDEDRQSRGLRIPSRVGEKGLEVGLDDPVDGVGGCPSPKPRPVAEAIDLRPRPDENLAP